MKLEIGKRYIRRDGKITGPLEKNESRFYPFIDPFYYNIYTEKGDHFHDWNGSAYDLVAECTEPEAKPNEPEKTLRDEFALASLSGMLANSSLVNVPNKDLAEISYRVADAMLAARKEQA